MTSLSARSQRGQKRWIPRQWRDRVELYNYLEVRETVPPSRMPVLTRIKDFDQQKQAAYDEMDKDGFGFWTVCTAGAGFLAGAYDVRLFPRLKGAPNIDMKDLRRQHRCPNYKHSLLRREDARQHPTHHQYGKLSRNIFRPDNIRDTR